MVFLVETSRVDSDKEKEDFPILEFGYLIF